MRSTMQRILLAAICLILAGAVEAQTSAALKPKPAGLGRREAATNEETNIRAYIELLRTDVRKSKSQIVGEVMRLDSDESARFWPVYKNFETELSALGDQVVALVTKYAEHYDNMTDGVADELANQLLDIERQRNALKKKYYGLVKTALGATTAARFLQVENQLERLVDLQIASQLPVVSQPPSASAVR
jgi:hypothetical protein